MFHHCLALNAQHAADSPRPSHRYMNAQRPERRFCAASICILGSNRRGRTGLASQCHMGQCQIMKTYMHSGVLRQIAHSALQYSQTEEPFGTLLLSRVLVMATLGRRGETLARTSHDADDSHYDSIINAGCKTEIFWIHTVRTSIV